MLTLGLVLDPENHRQGFSPVKTLLREIYGDESAGQMATSILANMGVPSFMITPKDEYGLTEEEGESISKAFQRRTGGQNRGKPLVLSGGVNVERLAFSPKDLEIGDLRESFEARVSAVIGVPSILAGMEVGLNTPPIRMLRLYESSLQNKSSFLYGIWSHKR